MAELVTKYKIFLASPSDLSEERNAIEEVITELNQTHGNKNDYVLELLKWETHSVPGIAKNHVQELINSDLGQSYDIFIGMLWTRFGTPTKKEDSGTAEEFQLAYERHLENSNQIKVLFYFKNTPKPLNEIDPYQLQKVQDFKKSLIDQSVLYGEFETVETFKQYLRMHIPVRVDDLKAELLKTEEVTIIAPPEDIAELGLIDYQIDFTNYLNETNHSLTKIIESTEWIGTEINKSATDITRFSKLPNHNEHILRSLLHRTSSAMDDYTNRIKSESPIFQSNYEASVNSGIGLLNVLSDFNNDDNLQELIGTKDAIFGLKAGLINGISSMEEFYSAVSELPRIEQKFNKSRQRMSNELNQFIINLKDLLKLTEEFSKQIGDRIDKMKLKLNH